MSARKIIRVFEHERLTIDPSKGFEKRHLDALQKYNDKHYNKYFTRIADGVKFRQYVGVIQVGNVTIEILPKADKNDRSDEDYKYQWRNVLLEMLRECRRLRVDHIDNAFLSLRSNSLLEVYIGLFLSHAERLLHEGLVKKYIGKEGNLHALKGRLIFGKHLSQNIVQRNRFYTRHVVYNQCNIYNQLLQKTLCLIPFISNNKLFTDKVNRLLLHFPEIPGCKADASTFEKLVYDRKTERFKEALLISKMLLLNFRPDIKGGHEHVIAIMFDMNRLWEEFIFRRLAKIAPEGTTVTREQQNFWFSETQKNYKAVKPDIIIKNGNGTLVVDAKWKHLAGNAPADHDLKQMFVYNLLWNAERSFLIYPGNSNYYNGSYLHFPLSKYSAGKVHEEFYNHCSLVFLDLLTNEGRLVGMEPFTDLLQDISRK